MFVNSDNYIKYLKLWLITLYLLIILMVAVGGLTRLTDSGLSITAWELFIGILPPLNINEWNFYFTQYKKIPEYQNINYGMSLSEFKIIFYWEYAHRLLARLVGLFSLIPLIFFSLKFKDSKFYSNKYYFIFFLVCLQGFIGWYMVSSGLIENNDVSHFRLSVHLSLALLILSLIFWFILEVFRVRKFHIKISNFLLLFILVLIFIQILLGAFLSGLDGGLIYNSWPDMNGSFFPNDVKFYEVINSQLLSNPSIVQFLHRSTAYLLLFFIIILNYFYIKQKYDFKYLLFFDVAILIQIFLGIITLISGVDIKYASLHQLGSILVLSSYFLILYKNSS
ncbi:cytochrome c oxidase assembly protein subunit 15 [Candidatus Pelagibacter ubique]|uniref:Heme A synthase n=1 Tax=Pelagibacter ubique TaxID=198252 RepID=A0ABX1T4N2_PELUQ|nr:COX15/CtaA family protein [Candidatus Pelagibacter ubique]NMN67983.1 cytochrome c oxidase assembly protein subunit 15 [Candidatus Pelagibacter ubique]